MRTISFQARSFLASLITDWTPDASARKVSETQAIDDDFGGTYLGGYRLGSGHGYEKQHSGYLLVDVRQCDADSIFEPVADSTIPEHLRDFVSSHGIVDQ
jgi:hypothetical protein